MPKTLVRCAAVLGLLAVIAGPAAGAAGPKHGGPGPTTNLSGSGSSSFSWNGTTVCGGDQFATCASVNVTTFYDATTGITQVTMQVTNLSGTNGTYAGTIFTQMGMFNLPPGVTYSGGLTVVDENGNPVSGWQTGTAGLSGAGIQPVVIGVDPTAGINGGLAAPHTYTFTFNLTGFNSVPDLSGVGFAIHGQGGPNGCSTKLVITNGVGNTPSSSTSCVTPPTVTPEPVSMTLLATGLAGVSGVGFLKRRRRPAAS